MRTLTRILSVSMVVMMGLSVPAHAFVVDIDNFEVRKNGSTLMNDNFNVAGAINEADLFPSGSQAFYSIVDGVAQSEGVVAGRRTLNTALAPLRPSTLTPGSFFRFTAATLRTNTQPLSVSTRGLKKDDTFKVTGIFDLVDPGGPGAKSSGYGVRLRDRVSSANPGNDELRMEARRSFTGNLRIRFSHRDQTANTLTSLQTDVLDLSHDQIALMLAKTGTASNAITASYAYIDGGVMGATTTFGTTFNIFNGEEWTRAGFRAIETVPEPASLAVFGLGLAGIGFLRRRRAA